jgi:hypothetical protein
MADTSSPDESRDHDDDLLGYHDLLAEGLDAETARAVLGPHSALTYREIQDRLGMIQIERETSEKDLP